MTDWITNPEVRATALRWFGGVLLACTTGFASLTFAIILRIDASTTALHKAHTERGGYDERLTRLETKVENHEKSGHIRNIPTVKNGERVYVRRAP